MRTRTLRAYAVLSLAPVLCTGCVVLGSKYEAKSREADTLRDAVAAANKGKSALEARIEALGKQLADEKELSAALAARLKEQEEAARRASEELAAVRKNYEGNRLTREQLIAELLEKEKASGKRIQDLVERQRLCEEETARLRKELSDREAQAAELRRRVEQGADAEALRRERDILAGRVERLMEERAQEAKRRDERLAALPEILGPGAATTLLGPAAQVSIPGKVLLAKGGKLSEAARTVVSRAGKAAAEFPSASVVVLAAPRAAALIREVLMREAGLPEARIAVTVGDATADALLFILVP